MKIIRTGKVPTPELPWWVGKRVKCDHCRTEAELEEDDKVTEETEKRPNGDTFAISTCPLCSRQLALKKRVMRVSKELGL